MWTCARLDGGAAPEPLAIERIVMRDERGERSPVALAMRRFFGLDLTLDLV